MQSIWQPTDTPPTLATNAVHIWRVWLDHQADWMWDMLSAEEQARAKRFKFDRHRRRHIVARASLRHLLGRYFNWDPAHIQLPTTSHGKPYVQQLYGVSELCFNVSHSHECALIGFTLNRRIGVDVEHKRSVSDVDGIAKHFFAEGEIARLGKVSAENKHDIFLQCWTRKEAFIKAIGEGLSHPLKDFEVTFLPDEVPQLLYSKADPDGAMRWQMREVGVSAEYIAAFIAEEPPSRPLSVKQFQLATQ